MQRGGGTLGTWSDGYSDEEKGRQRQRYGWAENQWQIRNEEATNVDNNETKSRNDKKKNKKGEKLNWFFPVSCKYCRIFFPHTKLFLSVYLNTGKMSVNSTVLFPMLMFASGGDTLAASQPGQQIGTAVR